VLPASEAQAGNISSMANDQRFLSRSTWVGGLAGAFLLFTQQPGFAQGQCDCSRILGQCQGTVTFRPKSVTIKSNTSQCSWVQFSVNGDPHTSTFTGGSNSEEWLASPPRQGQVSVDSCRICASVGQSNIGNPPDSSSSTTGLQPPLGTWVRFDSTPGPNSEPACPSTITLVFSPNNRGSMTLAGACPSRPNQSYAVRSEFSYIVTSTRVTVTGTPFRVIGGSMEGIHLRPGNENQYFLWDEATLREDNGTPYSRSN
jgi:hypothetical protein